MKNRSVIKILYKNYNGVFLRNCGNRFVNIDDDITGIVSLIDRCKISKMNFFLGDRPAVLWRDRHGNYILRYFSPVIQTEINL